MLSSGLAQRLHQYTQFSLRSPVFSKPMVTDQVGQVRVVDLTLQQALLALQAFQVLFLWIHDWVPLGRLNDVAAVRSQDTTARLIRITLIQSLPYTIGLAFSAFYYGKAYPAWLDFWLAISYGLLLVGQFRAWWFPYLIRPEPERAKRYRMMFGKTHAFLPLRNGMVPNTAHILLHVATATTLVLLLLE
jgi:hypothetical protein